VIAPEADLGEDVEVGPFVVIEGPVKVGDGVLDRFLTDAGARA
jgi:acyl-[acyl carrier protein]--UDP-N-acetylglucosamine O-acyltransferase